ncbi:hypothetical protein COU61_02145 [Candidatus Pacearchaeota archaeon CG10_big_fil_rev_8_21_14_0_10_35_13]|nr:MAG: hypothetical protein COU61_02145 [Candidatus Pacearchaeota archaeon CG10_big_fil_rev_8_21_14_0_10_35_13]
MLQATGIGYFLPMFGALLVFIVVYVLLNKTKLFGDSKFVQALTSLILAVIFVTVSGAVKYITMITPWVVVLLVVLFFTVIILSMSGGEVEKIMKGGLMWVFIAAMIIVFLIAAINVFNPILAPYLPGSTTPGGTTLGLQISNFLFSGGFLGSVLILGVGILVAWIVAKGDSGDSGGKDKGKK